MNDDIQRLVESLRSPGLEPELRGESFAVDAIASTMTAKDSSMNNRLPKKARVASFIAAGIIGFGGVAAAGPAVIDQIDGTPDEPAEPVTTDDSVPDDTVESTMPTTTDAIDDDIEGDENENDVDENDIEGDEKHDADEQDADDDADDEVDEEVDEDIDDAVLIDDPDTAFDETKCAEGSHGKTVSSVARSDGRTSQDVVDAAQSSCGKPADPDQPGDTADDATDADADVVDDEAEENTPEPEQEPDERNGNSNSANSGGGNSNANSRNGNGNSGNGNGNSGSGNSNGGGNGNGNSGGRGGK